MEVILLPCRRSLCSCPRDGQRLQTSLSLHTKLTASVRIALIPHPPLSHPPPFPHPYTHNSTPQVNILTKGSDTEAEAEPQLRGVEAESNPLHVPASDVTTYDSVPTVDPELVTGARVVVGAASFVAPVDSDNDEPSH